MGSPGRRDRHGAAWRYQRQLLAHARTARRNSSKAGGLGAAYPELTISLRHSAGSTSAMGSLLKRRARSVRLLSIPVQFRKRFPLRDAQYT